MEDLEDSKYMNHAIVLAKKGEGWVSPNPMVGAVIVKKERLSERDIIRHVGSLMLNEMHLPAVLNQRKVQLYM